MVEDLQAVREDVVARLEAAASNRRSPMHTPVVATTDADARVMVLRHFDRDSWTLRFHTDLRAPKVSRIGSGAPLGVLFYDAPEKIQIRCRGIGRVESETAAAQSAWDASTAFARRCYLGAGPGEQRGEPSSGLPEWAEGIQPNEEDLVSARENFAILLVEIETVDWYRLSHNGHRRALLTSQDGQWLTP